MKDYQQRVNSIDEKIDVLQKQKKSRLKTALISVGSTLAALVMVTAVSLTFTPMFGGPQSITQYSGSEYYSVIKEINEYDNRYDTGKKSLWNIVTDNVDGIFSKGDIKGTEFGGDIAVSPDISEGNAGAEAPGSASGNGYQETTLNQVDGIIEGDILKRSNTHAFYLKRGAAEGDIYYGRASSNYVLEVYTIEGEASHLVTTYTIKPDGDGAFLFHSYYGNISEMYMNADATALTAFVLYYGSDSAAYTAIIRFDISNPENITEISRKYVAGYYISSRYVNGEFIVATNFAIPNKPDYSNEGSYIPSYGAYGDMSLMPMSCIYLPDKITTCGYTVVLKLDENLNVAGKQALLSYTQEIAVFNNYMFASRTSYGVYEDGQKIDDIESLKEKCVTKSVTEIVCIDYKGSLTTLGNVTIDGTLNDRYSLDEKDGVLRAVTTIRETHYEATRLIIDPLKGTASSKAQWVKSVTSASLFCVDLSKMEIIASVERFADNESVQSARFSGDVAYVCTAVRMTDPVFAFDLSDYSNITYKDTGSIPGYSISLLPFGDYLLGIGFGKDTSTLKFETYKVSEDGVDSVDSIEYEGCWYSTEYKAHFVDASRGLAGLMLNDYSYGGKYLLVKFEEDKFEVALLTDMAGDCGYARAFYADGFYVVTNAGGISYFDLTK